MDHDTHDQAEAWDTDPTLYRPCLFRLNETYHPGNQYLPDGPRRHVTSECLRDKGHLGPHLFGKPDREVTHLMGLG